MFKGLLWPFFVVSQCWLRFQVMLLRGDVISETCLHFAYSTYLHKQGHKAEVVEIQVHFFVQRFFTRSRECIGASELVDNGERSHYGILFVDFEPSSSVRQTLIRQFSDAHSFLPSSKSISFLPSLNVESIFSTCRMSEFAPLTSSSMTLAGIFIFSLRWRQKKKRNSSQKRCTCKVWSGS